jgi:hypothetical protein
VEHQTVQSSAAGVESVSDPVTDYYVGSAIVSVRADESRLIVDFSRREVTEIRSRAGTWSTISFGRMGELRRRLAEAEGAISSSGPSRGASAGQSASGDRNPAGSLVVEPMPEVDRARTSAVESPVLRRGSIRALALFADEKEKRARRPALELWTDSEVRLGAEALAALADFEGGALGAIGATSRAPLLARLMAEGRSRSSGGFVVRSRRPVGSGPAATWVEDLVTRLDSNGVSVPPGLLEVPEGFVRVPHPLEGMVGWAEEEASRRLGPASVK